MFNIGFWELIVILLVALLVVGPKDLPKVARSLARGIKRLRAMVDEVKRESGLGEVEQELKQVTREVKGTLQEADIRPELREARRTLDKELKDTSRQLEREVEEVKEDMQQGLRPDAAPDSDASQPARPTTQNQEG